MATTKQIFDYGSVVGLLLSGRAQVKPKGLEEGVQNGIMFLTLYDPLDGHSYTLEIVDIKVEEKKTD